MATTTLNTIWHGSFLFVFRPENIEVLIPEFQGHGYWAGPWDVGGLQPLVRGTEYTLRGAKEKEPKVTKIDRVIGIGGPLADDYQKRVHSSWMLPYPKSITVPVSVDNEKKNFRKDLNNPNSAEFHIPGLPPDDRERMLGIVYVLTFELEDQSRFSVDHLHWDPPLNKRSANLHIFSQEEHRLPLETLDQHSTSSFLTLVSLTKAGAPAAGGTNKQPPVVEVAFQGEIPLAEPVRRDQIPLDADKNETIKRIEFVNLASSGLLNRRRMQPDPKNLRRIGPSIYQVVDTGNHPGLPCPGAYNPA